VRLFGFVFVFVVLLTVPAFAQEAAATDPLTALLGLIPGGAAGTWGVVALALFAAVRAVAATLSKHITDERLGELAPVVNWLGGNTKKAANK
jgi:hypothetical protein